METPAAPLALLLPWLPVLLGAALCALYVVRVTAARVRDEPLTAMLRKLLDAGNAPRAVKLTHAAPASPLCAAARAALLACAEGVRQGDLDGDYRNPGDLSPERVLAPVRARYDAAFDATARPLRVARVPAALGALALLAGAAAPWTFAPGAYGLAVTAALGLAYVAWTVRTDLRIARSRDRLFAALAGPFEALVRHPHRDAPAETPTAGLPRLRFEVSEPGREPRVVECDGEVVKIGAHEKAHVRLDAPGVARMHAVVELTRSGAFVIDLGNDPPTEVNGAPVTRHALADGDTITVGAATLRVHR